MSPEILIWGALAVMWGGPTLLKWYSDQARERRQRSLPPAQVCGCKHPISLHDEETGECLAEEQTAVRWERNPLLDARDRRGRREFHPDDLPLKVPTEWEVRRCRCVRYSGPDPEGRFVDLALRLSIRRSLKPPTDAA